MADEPYIPRKTLDELNASHPTGTRHEAMKKIAISLIGNGLSEQAVFSELRTKFPAKDIPDAEIEKIVRWASQQGFQPSAQTYRRPSGQWRTPEPKKPADPAELVKWWLAGGTTTLEKLIESSPIPIPKEPKEMAATALELLYEPNDNLNIVAKHSVTKEGKANPKGGGKILPRVQWCEWFLAKGIPQGEAGAWFRMNPVAEVGSGDDGAPTNDDVTQHRFVLVESDVLPLELQLAFYARLKLPIALIESSGGKSIHAWVAVNARDRATYEAMAVKLMDALAPFGIDKGNRNPSRLSRLPGAHRKIKAQDGGIQRLLYLRVIDQPWTEADLEDFIGSLAITCVEEFPMRPVVERATERYEFLFNNQGKTGVMTGITGFDRTSGGLKPGQMTVVASGTNGGKTTFALNIVNYALMNNVGVLLVTLEMDKDEIIDILAAMNARVHRSVFNTGAFQEEDFQRMGAHLPRIAQYRLWIEDSPFFGIEQLRRRAQQLTSEGKIGLIVVDYVQLIPPPNHDAPREQQVAQISRELRMTAKAVKQPIIAISQVNDENKLRESRALSHEAHNVILLETTESGQMKMKVVKGRSIPKMDYLLDFQPEYSLIKGVHI